MTFASHTISEQNILWHVNDNIIKKITLIALGTLILSIASQLSIPLQPVPLTFQSATVILLSMAFGFRYAIAIIVAYLTLGILGLPVFADSHAGVKIFFGPTGGYLIGFVLAAMVTGYLAQNGFAKTFIRSFITALLGTCIIFLCGVTVLSQMIGFKQAILFGMAPFVFSEIIKLLAVAYIVPRFWKNKN